MSISETGARQPTAADPTRPMEPDASLGELLGRLTNDFGELVTTQVELAKVEIQDEVKRAGKGAAIVSGGAAAAMLAVLLVSFAAAWGLAEVIEPGWAFLVVGIVWAVIAAVMVSAGRNRLSEVQAVPESRSEIKEDVRWTQQQKS